MPPERPHWADLTRSPCLCDECQARRRGDERYCEDREADTYWRYADLDPPDA
jgi:hypothetical protein